MGKMEKNMETIIVGYKGYRVYIGFRVRWPVFCRGILDALYIAFAAVPTTIAYIYHHNATPRLPFVFAEPLSKRMWVETIPRISGCTADT